MTSFPNWQARIAVIDHHYNPLPPLPWWAWIRRRRRHRAQMAASLAALAKSRGQG